MCKNCVHDDILNWYFTGIRQTGSSDADIVYDIIFDHPFPWGLKLECSVERCYSLTAVAFINVDYGLRQQREKMKSGKPTAVVQPSGVLP